MLNVPLLSFPEEISMHGLEYGDEAEPPVNQAIAVSLHNYLHSAKIWSTL